MRIKQCSAPNEQAYQRRQTNERTQNNRVFHLDLLRNTNADQSYQSRYISGNKYRKKYIRRISRTQLCTISHNRRRNQRQTACTQYNEHDHRIRCLALVFIQLL